MNDDTPPTIKVDCQCGSTVHMLPMHQNSFDDWVVREPDTKACECGGEVVARFVFDDEIYFVTMRADGTEDECDITVIDDVEAQ